MQTIKILTPILDATVPEQEKYHVELYEATNVIYRWYKFNKAEFDHFVKEHEGFCALFDTDEMFKRRKDAGMVEEINFCHLYFYDSAHDRFTQFALIDATVFIMNSAGQTIDKIYS